MKISYKLHLGFFDIFVLGTKGERTFFRLPLHRLGDTRGCKGLMVVNLATASVGLIDSISLVGPLHRPTLVTDILARCSTPSREFAVPLELASALALGVDKGSVALPDTDALSSSAAAPAVDHLVLLFQALVLDELPVRDTVWLAAPPLPPMVCRSSRLARSELGSYVSIVDQAAIRKKVLNEGTEGPARRPGELCADELLAVAAEDDGPLVPEDVQVLGAACDISAAELGLAAGSSVVPFGSP
jgi:hypothetical protein